MQIIEALNWGKEQIQNTAHEKRIASANPLFDAQLLLANCLEKSTSFLFAHFEDMLSEGVLNKYMRLISRRANHEPIAYILGKQDFYGRTFIVNPSVLIPRPETESLIDLVKPFFKYSPILFDIGTGSGAIAITIASESKLPVIAIDICKNALSVAKTNASMHGVSSKISFLQGNLFEPIQKKKINLSSENMGILMANLPYEPSKSMELMDPDVTKYEPKRAIDGGCDGLDYYDKLLAQIKINRNLLPKNLIMFFEINPIQKNSAMALILEYFQNADIKHFKDLSGKTRIIQMHL